ncbi:MAG: TatD DNase family protein [Candidatus Omnitrophota bacterium]|jgi:TatD DNase family protein
MKPIMDTHCHIYFKDYDDDRDAVVQRARELGVVSLMNIGVDQESSQAAIDIAESNSQFYATVGLHPHSADQGDDAMIARLEYMADQNDKVKAIGEIGLDYFKSEVNHDMQQTVFRKMCGVAKKLNKPLVIHSRNAFDDTIQILREELADRPDMKVVFHCFSYDVAAMQQILDLGHYVSFTGIVTFKSATDLQECAKIVPLDQFLIETDSPYLTPMPHRGKRNEPAYVSHVAEFIAKLRHEDVDLIRQASAENAQKLFNTPALVI